MRFLAFRGGAEWLENDTELALMPLMGEGGAGATGSYACDLRSLRTSAGRHLFTTSKHDLPRRPRSRSHAEGVRDKLAKVLSTF